MIVKFFSHGSGGGRGPVDYLLGKDRSREGARILHGDPETTIQLIDSLHFKNRYLAGVLSFEEEDITGEQKEKIMSEFERALCPGFEGKNVSFLWVEHKDKGRLELNFVVPRVELESGKQLQGYLHKTDKTRVNAWKNITNFKYKLSDPDDPQKKQALTLGRNLPKSAREASEVIYRGVKNLIAAGLVSDRKSLVESLQKAGFEVCRQTEKSISIKNPNGGRNLRLKGAIFERNFSFDEGIRDEINAAAANYNSTAAERNRENERIYRECLTRKVVANSARYPNLGRGRKEEVGRSFDQVLGSMASLRDSLDTYSLGHFIPDGEENKKSDFGNTASKSDFDEFKYSAGEQARGRIFNPAGRRKRECNNPQEWQQSDQNNGVIESDPRANVTEWFKGFGSNVNETTGRIFKLIGDFSRFIKNAFFDESEAAKQQCKIDRSISEIDSAIEQIERSNRYARKPQSKGVEHKFHTARIDVADLAHAPKM